MVKFYSEGLVKKARKLRKRGFFAKEIVDSLGMASKTTILRWCQDIPSNNIFHLQAEKIKERIKKKGVKLIKGISVDKEKAKFLASLLYWCEGNKYPSNNFVAFCNSDFNLVKTFLQLFRLGFSLDEKKIRVHLQLHDTHNKEEMFSFWAKLLKIPKCQFLKPTITKPTKRMKRKDYKGTCTLRYYDIRLLLEITGIFEEFSRKITENNF